jgi:folate-binding protein YgfZ
MIALTYLSAIRISGVDAGDFLHNQLSADVLALTPGDSTFACYCEPKGRVLALMLVSRDGDDIYVVMSGPLAASVVTRLRMYVMRAKVDIEILDNCVVLGVPAVEVPQQSPVPVAVVAVPDSDDQLIIAAGEAELTADPAPLNAWKVAELQRGITWLCPETSGQFLPQMLGYDSLGAVNFRKGCYPGQEIVARTHYLGKVKRHPRLLCTSAVICPAPLDNIQITSNEQSYDAVITDCGHAEGGGGCLYVVTRMDPDLVADQIEYQGQIAPLTQA